MSDPRDENLPAEREKPGQVTRAQERAQQLRVIRDNLLTDVENHRGDITQILTATGGDYETFVAGLRIFLMRTMQDQPDFFDNLTGVSFMEALMRCARDGLVPDGKEAAIAAYKDRQSGRRRATYMPMKDGFVKVLWRTGLILDINDQVVTAAEEESGRFEYVEGDEGYIRHRPLMSRKDSDRIVAAYCVVRLKSGGVIREVVTESDLEKLRKISRSDARKAWPQQMDRKAAIRRAMGKMPREKALSQLLEHDDENYDLRLAVPVAHSEPAGVRARLEAARETAATKPGFAPGQAEAALNPLSPEALDETLAGDDIPAEYGVGVGPDDEAQTLEREAPAADDGFPGDRPPPTAEEAVSNFLQPEEPEETPFAWSDRMRRRISDAGSEGALNEVTYGDFSQRMEALKAESPGAARALQTALDAARRRLAEKRR